MVESSTVAEGQELAKVVEGEEVWEEEEEEARDFLLRSWQI